MFTDEGILKDYAEGEKYKISLINERNGIFPTYGVTPQTTYDVRLDTHFTSTQSAELFFRRTCDTVRLCKWCKLQLLNYDGLRVPGRIFSVEYDSLLTVGILLEVRNIVIYSTIKNGRPFDVSFGNPEQEYAFRDDTIIGTIKFR